MSQKARTAYEDTRVDVHKTRGEIDGLLYKAGATGTAWMEGEHPDFPLCRMVALRFIKPEKVSGQTVQVAVRVMVPIPVAEMKYGSRYDFQAKEIEQRRRAYHRSLFYYLKAQIDAVERGLVQFTEAFLPHLETGNGLTVYQQIGPQYLQALTDGEIRTLALLPG